MELAYKHNWPEARRRIEAFWNREIIDRPCLSVPAPEKRARPVPPPKDFKTKWTDPDYVAERYDASHEATYFGGEAVPNTSLMVGYCLSYGAPIHYAEQTIWQEPIIRSWDPPPDLVVDENDPGLQQVEKVVARCLEVSAGKWMTSFPNIHQPNDHVAVLRGSAEFCMDMIDHPDELKRCMRRVLDNWFVVYERIGAMLTKQQEGMVTWLPVWCPWPRHKTLQSDISCAISPAMFEEFIAPELEEMCDYLDGVIYHLDGPDALQHLDRLLSIDGIHAIQWTPGAGKPEGLAWLDLYRRIQAAGKGIVISLKYDEVETAVRELKPEGLFILTSAPSPDAAEALLDKAAAIL
ncbi:MAG: hypothetical protein GXP25_01575 [Planctomycetes bacterium]|nr:hypothetical protein [Planctomycetota bacterium]